MGSPADRPSSHDPSRGAHGCARQRNGLIQYDGRAIELQLRTTVMHQWALAVERYSERLGDKLKQGGTHRIQYFLRVSSQIMALVEGGNPFRIHSAVGATTEVTNPTCQQLLKVRTFIRQESDSHHNTEPVLSESASDSQVSEMFSADTMKPALPVRFSWWNGFSIADRG